MPLLALIYGRRLGAGWYWAGISPESVLNWLKWGAMFLNWSPCLFLIALSLRETPDVLATLWFGIACL